MRVNSVERLLPAGFMMLTPAALLINWSIFLFAQVPEHVSISQGLGRLHLPLLYLWFYMASHKSIPNNFFTSIEVVRGMK